MKRKTRKRKLLALCDRCQDAVDEVLERRDGNLITVTVYCHGEALEAELNLNDLPDAPEVNLVFFTPEQDREALH